MPLGGALVGGGIALTGAIVKGIRARKQRKAAEKINPVRPEMVRTNASKENEAMFRQAAGSTRLPGQAYAENQIGAQTARANNLIQQTGGSTGEIIGGLTAVDDNARRATNDLSYQGAQLNQENKRMFGQVLSNVSEEEKEIFDANKMQPFQTELLRKQSLLDASSRNTDNAISGLQDTAENIGVAAGYNRASKNGESEEIGIPSASSTRRKSLLRK